MARASSRSTWVGPAREALPGAAARSARSDPTRRRRRPARGLQSIRDRTQHARPSSVGTPRRSRPIRGRVGRRAAALRLWRNGFDAQSATGVRRWLLDLRGASRRWTSRRATSMSFSTRGPAISGMVRGSSVSGPVASSTSASATVRAATSCVRMAGTYRSAGLRPHIGAHKLERLKAISRPSPHLATAGPCLPNRGRWPNVRIGVDMARDRKLVSPALPFFSGRGPWSGVALHATQRSSVLRCSSASCVGSGQG